MAEEVKTDLDTPAGYNGQDGPGDALKMPTKHYDHDGMGKREHIIEGPCDQAGEYK